MTNPNFELLIDSGAFTALNAGKEIKLDEYIAFCHRWKKHLFGYMALDKLQDPKTTDRNLKEMMQSGLKPIPVHVLGDDEKRMDELFEMSPWVAFGGLRRPHRGPMAVYAYIKKKMEWARGRQVHWLGYSRKLVLEAFKPFSCDCSSWAYAMIYGKMTFYLGEGQWIHFTRKQLFDDRLHDNPRFRQALAFYKVPLSVFLSERHWHYGNREQEMVRNDCMVAFLPARCWVRYAMDFKLRFGVRIFLAIADHQVALANAAYKWFAPSLGQ